MATVGNISNITLPNGNNYGIKAVAIPFGAVNGSSTSTVFTATVTGITQLADGVCVYLKNGVVSSASGFTLNVNSLGAKPVYSTLASSTAVTTGFNVNTTMLFIYNSSRVTGGCWDMYCGVDTVDATSVSVSNTTLNITTGITNGDGVSY